MNTKKINVENITEAAHLPKKKRGQLEQVWLRLKKDKVAMACLGALFILILIAVFADVLVSYEDDVVYQEIARRLQGPSLEHWFGTDMFGRDVFSRVLYATKISLSFGIITSLLALLTGGVVGCIAGYYGGWFDFIIMRLMDIIMAVPFMLFAIAIVSALGTSLTNLMIAMLVPALPGNARLFRSVVMSIKEQDFVEAARAVGAKDSWIIMKHIIPNTIGPVITTTTLNVASVILTIASLSFLGLGVQPPLPEWGQMLSEGKSFMEHMHLIVFPGIAIMIVVLVLNLLGDGLNDALDPKLR